MKRDDVMKYRNTVIVLVVLAALIAFVYYNDQQSKSAPTPTPTPAPETRILDLKAEDVTGIQISTPLSRTVARKENDVWFLSEPNNEEADTARLNNLVTDFAKLKATRALTDTPTNLAPFGLVTGTLTVTLQLKDNRAETVRFGNLTVGGNSYYAQRVGDPRVYFVSSTTFADAQRLTTLIPKKPTPTPTPRPTETPTASPSTAETPQGPPLPPSATPSGTPRP